MRDDILFDIEQMINNQLAAGYTPGTDDDFWAKDTAHVIACKYDLDKEDPLLKEVEKYVNFTFTELKNFNYYKLLKAKGPLKRSLKENAEYEALRLHFSA